MTEVNEDLMTQVLPNCSLAPPKMPFIGSEVFLKLEGPNICNLPRVQENVRLHVRDKDGNLGGLQ